MNVCMQSNFYFLWKKNYDPTILSFFQKENSGWTSFSVVTGKAFCSWWRNVVARKFSRALMTRWRVY